MADVERLLSEYIQEHRAGGPADPVEYLERVEGADRAELAALIDAYLMRAPGREWDPEAFAGSPAEALTESLHESLHGAAGLWPRVLPQLRKRSEIMRDELVRRLAEQLGVADKQRKVGEYYNRMEHGTIYSAGVSQNVLAALAGIVGVSAESLRSAGRSLHPPEGGVAEEVAFARIGFPDERYAREEAAAGPPQPAPAEPEEWDEVDELFRGGAE